MLRSELARVRAMATALAAQLAELGADDPRTIESRLRLAEAYEQLPDYEDEQQSWEELAIAEVSAALDARVRTLGPDHRDTLALRYDLAFKQLHQEMDTAGFERLATQLRGIADDADRALGPTDPDTLGYWGMLSRHCPQEERPELTERVRRGWEHVRAERERQLGPDDPRTLEVMLHLAHYYAEDEALRRRQEVAAGWGRIAAERAGRLGPVHPDTVAARERHIALHDAWVARDGLRGPYEELAADHERLLGPDHPRSLHMRLEALDHTDLRGTDPSPETIAAAERLIDRMLAVLGPEHEDFLMMRYKLALAHVMRAGDREAAEAVFARYPSPRDEDSFRWAGPER